MDEKYVKVEYKKVESFMDKLMCLMWSEEYPLTGWKIRTANYNTPASYNYLDDWRDISVGENWIVDTNVTAFFSVKVDVPANCKNKDLYLNLTLGGEALVYINGAPYHGLDRNRSLIKLDEKLKASETLDVLIEAAIDRQTYEFQNRYWMNVEYKPHKFTVAKFIVLNEIIQDYYYDLSTVKEYYKNLPIGELSDRYIKVLKDSIKAVEFEGGRNKLLETVVKAKEILHKGIGSIDVKLSQVTAALLGHSHIDVGYLWPVKESIRKSSRTFSTALRLMDQYSDYRFIQTQAMLYDNVKQYYPSIYEGIKSKVEEGQWEPEGAMWVEPDCNLISGESMIRQMLYGKEFFKSEFGRDCKILWLPDTFGFSWGLPQIMKGCGIDYFVTTKLIWNKTNAFPHNIFKWRGLDGSEVVSLLTGPYNGNLSGEEINQRYESFSPKDTTNGYLHLYGHGDGGGGVTFEMLETAKRLNDFNKNNIFKSSSAIEYLNGIENTEALPVWNDELYLEAHRGTYTTHAKLKELNRRCEREFRDAEFFLSIAQMNGDKKRGCYEDLKKAWKKVLTNQFHDILPGSTIKETFDDAVISYNEALKISDKIKYTALASLVDEKESVSLTSEGKEQTITVWNTLSWVREDIVIIKNIEMDNTQTYELLDDEGQEILWQFASDGKGELSFSSQIPAMGFRVFKLRCVEKRDTSAVRRNIITPSSGLTESLKIESQYYEIEFNSKGNISSIYDKEDKREVLAVGKEANVFQVFIDEPEQYDGWEVEEFHTNKWYDNFELKNIEVMEEGSVLKKIRLKKQWNKTTIIQDIRLYENSRRIDFNTEVDWKEDRKLLKVAFPVNILAREATYDIAYGSIKRATHDNTSWDKAKFEVPAHMWADLSEYGYGVSLLNDSKYGYDIKGNTLRLSLLKAPINPNPYADRGTHKFVYSFLPHLGSWEEGETSKHAYELNTPYTILMNKMPKEGVLKGDLFKLDCDNVVIEAVKPSEDEEGIVIRLLEKFGQRCKVKIDLGIPVEEVYKCNMLEEAECRMDTFNNSVIIDVDPYKIITLKLRIKAKN